VDDVPFLKVSLEVGWQDSVAGNGREEEWAAMRGAHLLDRDQR
jgi:hypothetical protein